jgi:hypothetical protein
VRRERQGEPEPAAPTGLAVDTDGPAHRLDDALASQESGASTNSGPSLRVPGSIESSEQFRLPMGRDADA